MTIPFSFPFIVHSSFVVLISEVSVLAFIITSILNWSPLWSHILSHQQYPPLEQDRPGCHLGLWLRLLPISAQFQCLLFEDNIICLEFFYYGLNISVPELWISYQIASSTPVPLPEMSAAKVPYDTLPLVVHTQH